MIAPAGSPNKLVGKECHFLAQLGHIILSAQATHVPMMSEKDSKNSQVEEAKTLQVGNLAEPIRLKDVQLSGVSAESALANTTVKIYTRLALTSDEPFFHRVAGSLSGVIRNLANKAGRPTNPEGASTVLMVIRSDNSAELWIDTAAVALQIRAKRSMQAGSLVFDRDVADVVGMSFPAVEIGANDRVVCLFRENWRFGLYFDLREDENLDLTAMTRDLGTLYRRLKYHHLYDIISNQVLFAQLMKAGWFPFVEILGEDFNHLADLCQFSLDLQSEEERLIGKFDDERLDNMLERWCSKPHFQSKRKIFEAAFDAFKAKQPISTIKIILTEIEGVLQAAHIASQGKSAKLPRLLKFARASAERKAGGPDTLLFPAAFGEYLSQHTFASSNPNERRTTADSRHPVGHGSADAESYTQTRALQALLTMDQVAFYT